MNGGVRRLAFDTLDNARVVTFGVSENPCSNGTCKCMLKWLHQISGLEEIVIDDARYNKCLGAAVAPYPYGLPPQLNRLSIVLHQSFLRWLHATYPTDYGRNIERDTTCRTHGTGTTRRWSITTTTSEGR